jgi:ribosome production factor 1
MLRLKAELKKNRKSEQVKRKKTREKTGEAAPEPRAIEKLREKDETIVMSDNEEVKADEAVDEFASHFEGNVNVKLLLTTSRRPSDKLEEFVTDFLTIFTGIEYYKRRNYNIKEITEYATARDFTGILVLTERLKKPNALWMIYLPEGPTAHFKLSNSKLIKRIAGHGRAAECAPELILNNFDTKLGRRCARLFASLFPPKPEFKQRRLVTFHNQRDYIFVRHHRYIFNEEGSKVKIQELGPRFTLKLRSL